MSSQSKRVAIIGAGTSGLTAIKELVAAGIQVQCFESASKLGGQWLYEPNPTPESHSSIYRGLVVNSCRDSSCFSDFPIDPARYPIFYPHDLHLRYIGEWAAHFDLEKHVRFGVSVTGCAPRKEGGWEVRVRSHDDKAEEEEVFNFDAVICGSGLSRRPKIPGFPGREAFEGEVLHSHFYRTPTPFDGKKVVIVGLGSTAVDLACEIGPLARELHVVNKRGAWIIPRFLLGKPAEAWNSRSSATWIPFSVQAFLYDKILAHALGPPPAVLKPDHKIMEQNPSVRGDFVEKLQSGVFSLHRASVSSFTASGVALDDGSAIDADVVILCTGYHHADLPYLPPGALAARDAPAPHVDLYKSVVPPRMKDLFVMGQVEVAGPAIPIIEAQARYITAILTGKLELPGEEAMMRDIKEFRAWQGRHFVNSERHTMTVEYNPYIDGLLAPLGAVPSGWRLLWRVFSSGRPARAFSVYKAVFFDIQIGAQWRLDGDGACRELAEETLIRMASGADRLSDGERALLGLLSPS